MKMLKIVQLIESMKHGLSINMELNGIELIICKENVEMLIHVEESDYSSSNQILSQIEQKDNNWLKFDHLKGATFREKLQKNFSK